MHGFYGGQVGDKNDVMSMDMDLLLDQDNGVADNVTHTITWDQWDSWLADSNVMCPLSLEEDFRAGT